MNKFFVFVYGSLKQRHYNNIWLEESSYFGTHTTIDSSFDMINLGTFPAVIDNGSHKIQGEIYEINDETFEWLDRLEGHPHFYERRLIDVDKFPEPVWIYILNENALSSIHDITKNNISIHNNCLCWNGEHFKR
jgi:gamma-glutamylcyclotransferase (GGCT)/AIG2-like uncharacterized protein YtfP